MAQDGVRWVVRAGAAPLVVGPQAPDWFDLEHDPRAVEVKAGRSRMTWRVNVGKRTVFAKVYDHPRPADRLRRWTLGGAPEREWRASRAAEARGVPIVRPIAVGAGVERSNDAGAPSGSFFRSVFLSEGLHDARRLSDIWITEVGRAETRGKREVKITLIRAVAHLFAAAHECGFAHGDAHPDNILVAATPTGQWDVRFVDVRTAHISHRSLPLRRALVSLAELDQSLHRLASRTDRLRFFRHYLAHRTLGRGAPAGKPSPDSRGCTEAHGSTANRKERELLGRLAQASAAHAARLARHRDRRLHRNGKYFATLRLGRGWKATVVLKLARRHLFPEPDVPDRTEHEWRTVLGAIIEKLDRTPDRLAPFCVHGLSIEPGRPGPLSTRLVPSSQRRLFEGCHKRRHRDHPSDLILACVEHGRAGMIDQSFLVRPIPDKPGDDTE